VQDYAETAQSREVLNIQNFPAGRNPDFLAFDVTNVWATNPYDNTVTILCAGGGSPQGTFPAGRNPQWITFDGINIWVSDTYGRRHSGRRSYTKSLAAILPNSPRTPLTYLDFGIPG